MLQPVHARLKTIQERRTIGLFRTYGLTTAQLAAFIVAQWKITADR